MRTDTGQTVYLQDYAPTPYRAPHTSLMFALHPTRTVVRATTLYEPVGTGPLELAGDGLELVAVELDGEALDESAYEAGPDRFVLKAPPEWPFALTLVTVVSPDDNTELMGLYRSNGVYCTQCEAEGYRRITYAYDRPDVLTVYDVFIVADGDGEQVLLSNGNLVERAVKDGRLSAHWHDPFPKPTYLFALVAGDLGAVTDTFTTMSGRKVELNIYVERGKEPRATYAMDALKRSMAWDETRFGREYDLDIFNIVAVSDFNMGAMENKGLNVFNDRYVLADPAVATDQDYSGIETVIAHEYFHNWTGNRITCRDWFQLCLKEGLTVFRDQEFTSDERSRGVKRIADVRRLRAAQFPEDASPLRHCVRPSKYDEISNLYTATVYDKGAELIRMIHTMIGEAAFRAGMDDYFARFDGTAATVEDFVSCFPLADPGAFMRWYEEPGTPTVKVDERYENGRYTLELTQVPAEGASIKPIPVRLALLSDTGAVDPAKATVHGGEIGPGHIVLKDRVKVTVDRLNAAPIASVMRGFSAPVTIERTADEARDLTLIAKDDDPFTVWDAVQRLAVGAMRARYDGAPGDESALAAALATLAANDGHEPTFRALALIVPTRQTLIEAIGSDVDPDKVNAAHQGFSAALGAKMQDVLARLYSAPVPPADDVSAEAAGHRALRNAAMHLLAAAGETDRAATQATSATTMTDRLAALGALAFTDAPGADDALAAFAAANEHEPLVLDKYFAMEAMRPDDGALERVRGLMEHPKFSLKTPNRVRSLIGAFAQNVAAFHRADGEGYRLVADVAKALDKSNPQVAARLLTSFSDVRRFDSPRREAAADVLADVLQTATSSDVVDIARRLTAKG
ncbi:aminopeptidase N [Acuticoccus sp. I52.16.1]|uniref:aminopeptidase N n=1 Tax=Acuticoccus sp. I52.16.1 TaxID=2928472 RepID=UPI001FD2E39F|nr:aminopeptidase N [Acuticoccus sp. I52.16.1]UOM34258.1 aminopeptidase N [Acuticoccus sp. I52.16.1]